MYDTLQTWTEGARSNSTVNKKIKDNQSNDVIYAVKMVTHENNALELKMVEEVNQDIVQKGKDQNYQKRKTEAKRKIKNAAVHLR